jgi:hypothetical protein
MTDPAPVVWAYWEDGPRRGRSAYLDMCLDLRVLSRQDTPTWLPDLDVERWEALPAPNFRSDYARSRVLQRYGGVWVDVDTIALAPLSRLLEELDDTGMVCFGKEQGRFFGGLCAAAPGSPFVDEWASGQDRMLDRHPDFATVPYAGLAQDVTWELARRLPWKALPMHRVAPVPWYQWRRFFSRLESPGAVVDASTITVVLWNAVMAPYLRDRTRDDLLRSKMLVARLLRVGMGRSTMAGEEDVLTRLAPLSAARFSLPGQRVEAGLRRVLGRAGAL